MNKFSLESSFARYVSTLTITILFVTFSGWIVGIWDIAALCVGWPLCVPIAPLGWLQFWHQLLAGVSGVLVLIIFFKAWNELRHNLVFLPVITIFSIVFFGQTFIGALEVFEPATQLVVLHDITTFSVWVSLLSLFIISLTVNKSEIESNIPTSPRLIRDFLILTKPWIVALLLVTTIAGLIAGYKGLPPFNLIFWTILGGSMAAGGSSALNQVIDWKLDQKMQRTSHRPIAAGRLTRAEGLAFGLGLCLASYYVLAGLVNMLAAALSVIGILYYVVIYSLWLKKSTTQNIVIGGGAGAIPPLVGWAAATNHLSIAAWILFGIIFLWTPPHFWALAIVRKKDYERVGIPMLPVVRGEQETRRQILIYTVVLISISLLLPIFHITSSIYLVSALFLGTGLFISAWKVWRIPGNKVAYAMYRWSSYYLLFLFVALVIDIISQSG
jgi:protoheme IX farnesyltransferase